MNDKALLLGFVTVMLASGAANADDARQPVRYCELIPKATEFDGKAVVVRANMKFSQDGFAIYDATCKGARATLLFLVPVESQDAKVTAAYRRLTRDNPYTDVDAVVEGRFRQAKMYECISIIGGCYSYALEDVVLKDVQELRR